MLLSMKLWDWVYLIHHFFTSHKIIPHKKKLLNDSLTFLCNNIHNYILVPLIQSREADKDSGKMIIAWVAYGISNVHLCRKSFLSGIGKRLFRFPNRLK